MQKLISQIPELSAFLSQVPKAEHLLAIKQIVKLGLQSLQTHCCKENKSKPNNLVHEIDRIKENLQELNNMVKYQCHHHCSCTYPNRQRKVLQQREPERNYHQNVFEGDMNNNSYSFQPPQSQSDRRIHYDPPVRETSDNNAYPKQMQNRLTSNPFSKNKSAISRHHLDDTEAKSALTFPPYLLADSRHPSKRRSQEYKKHIYQEQINKEQQEKIKEQRDDNNEEEGNRITRSVTDYRKTTSKIKSLLDKDRIRFLQRQREESFKEGFNKYEYSDENQMEESSIPEQPQKEQKKSNRPSYEENTYNQHYHSSFKGSNPASSNQKTSSKKQFERSKNEVSSKLEVSLGEPSQKMETQSKNSSQGANLQLRASERASDKYDLAQQDEEDDVISNSSSFSQFSISGSQKRDIGKISRRSNN